MRKIIIFALLFPLAFISGVIIQRRYVRSLAQYVSPCTVTEYRALYKTLRGSDFVNVRGFLYGGEVLYLADEESNGCGESIIGLDIPEDGKIAYASQNLITEIRRLTDKEKVAKAEFEVIGTLTERERNCFGSRYVIKVQQILPAGPLEVVDSSVLAERLKAAR